MHARLCSSLEPLEARIAPAAMITVTASGGSVKIVGDDAANDIKIQIISPGVLDLSTTNSTFSFNGVTGPSATVEFGKDISVALGGGADTIELVANAYYGNITLDGGSGSNAFKFTGGSAFVIPGSVKLLAKDGADTVSFNVPGKDFQVGRDFLVALGDGGVTTSAFALGRFLIGGKLTLNGGKGSEQLAWNPTSDIAIGGDVTIATGDGLDQISLKAGGDMGLTGKLTIKAGKANNLPAAPSIFASNYTVGATDEMTVRGAVSASSVAGETFFLLGGTNSSEYAGGLSVKGGKGLNHLTLAGTNQTYLGKVSVATGGPATFTMKPTGGFFFGGDFSYKGGGSGDIFDLEGNGIITGKVSVDLGDGATQSLTFTGAGAAITVFGDASFKQGAKTGTSSTVISGLQGKSFALTTGGAVDNIQLDDFIVRFATTISTGAGADNLQIERSGAGSPSFFGSSFKVALGDGDDTALIGVNGNTNSRIILGPQTVGLIDGGKGTADVLFGFDTATGAATNGNLGMVTVVGFA
ncbi:MAG: hypothetical protein WCF18_13630 [Chthoniobacteraceae bacterium]